MGTRASIMIERENGKMDGIYLHWDGRPSHVMPLLQGSYNNRKKAEALIDLGGISSLGKNIATKENHSFDNPVKGVTVAYHRDRGEELHVFRDEDIKAIMNSCDAEYGYIFKLDNSWTNISSE